MTTLPALAAATQIETEAMAFACAWFRYWRDGESPLAPGAFPAVMRQFLHASMTGDAVNRLRVVAMARAGESEAQAVIERTILELQSRGEPLPTELAAYNMDHVAGLLQAQQKTGPKRKSRMMRDQFIALAVEALRDGFNLQPTHKPPKGQPAKRPSGCVIVAEAYSREVHGLGHKAVEGIWRKQRAAMPVVPGWSAMFGAPGAFQVRSYANY